MRCCTQWKQLLLIILVLLPGIRVTATEPTTTSNTLVFSNVDGGQFSLSFKSGNGTGRIIVLKAGSEVTGKPVDGVNYNVNAAFGTAGTEFTAAGEYVVAKTSGTQPTVNITNLVPGTLYYVAIFEFNSTGTPDPDYSVITPTGQTIRTLSAPTTQANLTGFSTVTGNAVKVGWTNGNGSGRIIVARKGTSLSALPVDLRSYSHNTSFGANTGANYTLDAETFIVFRISGTVPGQAGVADITNLEPNTSYTFAVFEFNGYNAPVYLKPGSVRTITTTSGPSTPPGTITFSSIDGNGLGAYWSLGNGSRNIVVMKKGSPVTFRPQNGQTYSASPVFGNAATETTPGSGEYIVGNANAATIAVTGLEKSTTYYFAVFGYDIDAAGNTYYLTTSFSEKSQSTAQPPAQNKVVSVTSVTGSSAQLSWTNVPGNGAYRLVAIREGGPVEFVPQDLVKYSSATNVYGAGTQVMPGNYLLYGHSNGGAPNITGLEPGRTYHVSVFELNGPNAPVYLVPGATVVINIPDEPTTAPGNPQFPTVDGNAIRFDWTAGNGARRIVVAKKGIAVSKLPLDGVTYTASDQFGQGSELVAGSNEFIVYDGSGNTVTVSGLEMASTYHFAVFEYNVTGAVPDYLTATGKWLAASKTTFSSPTTQTTGLNVSNIQSNQATINFTRGNGSSRIFIMHENGPVDVEPQDLQSYTTSSGIFSTTQNQIGTGNCVVGKGQLGSFAVTGLKPGTNYSIAVFEFNGNSGPVYLRPGISCDFTTDGSVVIPAPTQMSSNPLFENVDGNKITLKWTPGNGTERIVVARKSNAVQFIPADGIAYTADAAFGSGTDLGSQQYVVYKGAHSTVTVSNLEPESVYHFAVYEYNGSGSNTTFLNTPLTVDHSTAVTPVSGSSGLNITTGTGSATLTWINGGGNNRLVVAKEGAAVTGIPVNLNYYVPNPVFKSGSQIADGEYVVHAGLGNTVQVTGLSVGKTYHFSVFDYNGTDAPVYNTSLVAAGSASFVGLPVSWLHVSAEEHLTGIAINWSTAQEFNTSHFEIEKSRDGNFYQSIGRVQAAGNSQQIKNYSYTDKTEPEGNVYYRIKQVDLDRNFSYSKIVQLKVSSKAGITLLQNPVKDRLHLKLTGLSETAVVLIVDLTGKVIFKGKINRAYFEYPVTHLNPGIYHITVRYNNRKESVLRFIKQ